MQISNAKSIVLNQEAEWTRMMAEESERQSLLRYGITLIVVAYVLLFVLSFLFSMAVSLVAPFSAMHMMTSVVVQFGLSVASLYFVPNILAMLAPSFGGENNQLNALKLFVFASTPAWLGTSVGVIPIIGWLAAIAGALYAVFLFWKHFTQALSIPEDKKVQYLAVAVLILIAVHFVIGRIGMAIADMVSPVGVYHIGSY
jgi:hypothetical protein